MESPIFFESSSRRLFGVYHETAATSGGPGWVIAHPFGEEKLWSHRVLVNLARSAANAGIPVLRFDFSGQGDSSGHTEDYSIDHYLEDIGSASRELRRISEPTSSVNLMGLRLGATLSCLYALKNNIKCELVLWEPIIDGNKYVQELLRINLGTQLAVFGSVEKNRAVLIEELRKGRAVNVDGYLITNEFFSECESIDLSQRDLEKLPNSVLVTQISPVQSQKDKDPLVELSEMLPAGRFVKSVAPPFWREIKPFVSKPSTLIADTVSFMEECRSD